MTTIPVELRELLERMAGEFEAETEWNCKSVPAGTRSATTRAIAMKAAADELRALLAEQPQAGAGQDVCDHKRQRWNLRGGGHCSDCGAPVGTSVAEEAARHDQGDDTKRLDFMIEKCARIGWNREGEYCGVFRDSDDDTVGECLSGWGARFTDPIEAIDAALTHSPKGEEE